MSTPSTAASAGTPICGTLGIVFVTLKLLGVITWSWWWVTAPFWAPVALALAIAALALLVAGGAYLFAATRR